MWKLLRRTVPYALVFGNLYWDWTRNLYALILLILIVHFFMEGITWIAIKVQHLLLADPKPSS
jgi:hypothetical protein